jgi:hypothetical protein
MQGVACAFYFLAGGGGANKKFWGHRRDRQNGYTLVTLGGGTFDLAEVVAGATRTIMRIPTTHHSYLSSLESHSGLPRCAVRETDFLAVHPFAGVAGAFCGGSQSFVCSPLSLKPSSEVADWAIGS